jgi:hypothetical protein
MGRDEMQVIIEAQEIDTVRPVARGGLMMVDVYLDITNAQLVALTEKLFSLLHGKDLKELISKQLSENPFLLNK